MGKINFVIGGVNIEMEQEEVSKAIEAGKVELKADDLVIYKNEDFETFKTNLSDAEYKKGKTAGAEMIIKDAREKHGLEFEGKTMENFTESFKAKVISETNVKPNERIKELESDLEKVRGNLTSMENEFTTYKTNEEAQKTRFKKDQDLLSYIPSKGILVDSDIAMIALKTKAGIDIDYQDGKQVLLKNGEVQKDTKTLQPIDPKPFIEETLTGLKLMGEPAGGRGEGDEGGNHKAGTYEAFAEEMEKQDISEGSEKFNLELIKRQKEGTLKF